MRLFRYLMRGVLVRWAVALPALTLVYLAFYMGDQGRILAARLGWGTAVQIGLLHLPLIAVQIMPVALLLAAVLGLGTLRQRGEIEALLAFGASPARLWLPVLCAGMLAASVALAVDELVVPASEGAADRLRPAGVASPLTGIGAPPRWFRLGDWLLRLDASRVVALELGPGFQPVRRVDGTPAPEGVRQAIVSRFEAGRVDRRRRARVGIPALASLRSLQAGRAEAMSSGSLARRVRRLEGAGQARAAESLLLHSKLAFPAVNLVMGLFACLFLVRRATRTAVGDLAWATLVVVGLWIALALGWVLARVGWIPAAAGAWGPVALGAGVALVLLHRRRRGPIPC